MNVLKYFCLTVMTIVLVAPLTAQDRGDRGRGDRGGRGERGRRFDRGGFDRSRFERGRDEGRRRDEGRGRDEWRRNWDPSEYLSRLDKNKNGYLDPNELDGRSRGFIQNMGFDVSRALSIKTVQGKYLADRDAKATQERQKELRESSKVSGFGEPMDLPPVADFSIDGPEPSLSDLFDESVVRQVEEILERYDTSGDKMLNSEERRRARLSSRLDTDGDEQLNPREIGEYYQQQANENRPNGSRNGSFSIQVNTGGQKVTTLKTIKTVPKPSSANKTQTQRTIEYVDSLFKKYDKNNDGQLDKAERKDVRMQFNDSDKDGKISRSEAISYVGGAGNKQSTSSTRSGSRSRDRGSRRGGDTSSDSGSRAVRRELSGFGRVTGETASRGEAKDEIRSRGVSSKYFNYDKNSDGQIQMSEFAKADEWTDAKIAEFNKYDSNRDGVITADEWAANGGR